MSDLHDQVRAEIGDLSASSAWGADWCAHLLSCLLRENEALVKRVEEQSMWQDISTAPRDGNFIIGFEPIYDGIVCQVWWCDIFRRWETLHNDYPMRQCVDEKHYIFECHPTHWMPLPPPLTTHPRKEMSDGD